MVKGGGFGKLSHRRAPSSIDAQDVVRMNRDTLYSFGVFDLDAGPVTITLPDAGKRFMSMQVLHRIITRPTVVYRPDAILTKTRSERAMSSSIIRTLVNPDDPEDIAGRSCAAGRCSGRASSAGMFEVSDRDHRIPEESRDALACWSDSAASRYNVRHQATRSIRSLSDRSGSDGAVIPAAQRTTRASTDTKRRKDSISAHRQGCARGRLLVDQPLQCQRLFREERPQRLLG